MLFRTSKIPIKNWRKKWKEFRGKCWRKCYFQIFQEIQIISWIEKWNHKISLGIRSSNIAGNLKLLILAFKDQLLLPNSRHRGPIRVGFIQYLRHTRRVNDFNLKGHLETRKQLKIVMGKTITVSKLATWILWDFIIPNCINRAD